MSLVEAKRIREQQARIRELEAVYSAAVGRIKKAKAILEPFKLSPEVHAARAIRLALAALEGK